MVKKIIHVADIHIRNIKRHDEYKIQFTKFIDKCKEVLTDCECKYEEARIVLVGDLFHQKIQISNEQTVLFSWFMRQLHEIAPIILVSGNHDLMESNMDRMDSITPIIELLGLPNIKYVDKELNYKSGCVVDDNLVWGLYSIFDNYNAPDIKLERINYPDKKFIGLFHGAITGAKTDIGFEIEHGVSADIFGSFDVVLCGDIHKRQEIYFEETKIVYPGSLIQQDIGESVSAHGFLLWDVETFDYDSFDLDNDFGFYKFKISSVQDMELGTEEFVNF